MWQSLLSFTEPSLWRMCSLRSHLHADIFLAARVDPGAFLWLRLKACIHGKKKNEINVTELGGKPLLRLRKMKKLWFFLLSCSHSPVLLCCLCPRCLTSSPARCNRRRGDKCRLVGSLEKTVFPCSWNETLAKSFPSFSASHHFGAD